MFNNTVLENLRGAQGIVRMICNNERVRQPACSMGVRISAGEAMNEGNVLQADWENSTREELLAELTRLQAEIARLTALLPAQ